MKSRHVVSAAIVVLGAILFLFDRVSGSDFLSFSANPRLAALPVASASPALAGSATPDPGAGAYPSAVATAESSFPSLSTASPTRVSGAESSATPAFAPGAPATPTGISEPATRTVLTRGEGQPPDFASVAPSRTEPASIDDLWNGLVGFSNKSNQEREQYVAEHLFPGAGLAEVGRQSVPYTGSFGPEYGNWDGLSNILAVRRGSLPASSRKLIVLGAHFDKVTYPRRATTPGRSDGIFDNGSGVNLIAKIAQSLRSPLNDVEVVAFASEEPDPYFLGSRVYFGKPADRQRIQLFANFDCLGSGNLALVEGAEDPSLGSLAERVAANEGMPLVWRAASGDVASDHLIAQYFGVRTLYFTSDDCEWRRTHVPEDNLSAVSKEAYYRQYLTSLKIIAYVDAYLAEAESRP